MCSLLEFSYTCSFALSYNELKNNDFFYKRKIDTKKNNVKQFRYLQHIIFYYEVIIGMFNICFFNYF